MNAARGEVVLEIEGEQHVLCLTLGALAELEAAFGCASLSELQTRLLRLSASELCTVLEILLRAAGSTADVVNVAPGAAARAVAEAFNAALG
ncbi:MAG: GTA-gp10 family protein [Pseudomonadota bacterium]